MNINTTGEAAPSSSDGRVAVKTANIDATNNVAKVQTKGAWGSAGRITSSGVLHNAPCTILGFNVQCTTAGTIDIADSVSGGGTSLMTLTGVLNQSYFVPMGNASPPMGIGIYATFTTFAGSITAVIGPPVQ